jgi:hypothetical protein
MTDPYVAGHIPLFERLVTLLDWAFVLHALLAGLAVFFALWAIRLAARVRELEASVKNLQARPCSPQSPGSAPLPPLADDRQIPPIDFETK